MTVEQKPLPTELIDALLADYKKPEDLIGQNGILKQLTKALVERALQAELTDHLGHGKNQLVANETGNTRNGRNKKTLKGDFGELPIEIPRDRAGTFEPQIITKHQTRWSVKHEDVYLNGYATMGELLIGLTKYFAFYNGQRPHQALGNQTPDSVHTSSTGGGAMIVEKYEAKPEPEGLPIVLCTTATAFGQVRIENKSARQNAKTGAAPFGCVKSGAT